jgi:hypothetical protein
VHIRSLAATAAVLLVGVLTVPAAAATPSNGLWADSAASCAAANKSKASNGSLEESAYEVIKNNDNANFITISGKIINDFEIQCTIGKAKAGGTPLACTGEGEKWKQTLTVRGSKSISFSGGSGIGGSYIWCRR